MMLFLLLQAAAPAGVAPPPQRFSILAQTCAPVTREGREVVVCGNDPATSQRLPLPNEAVPDHGIPSNPYVTGTGALAAQVTPCAATQWGCTVGFGPPIEPIVGAIVKGIRNAGKERRWAKARAADGTRRQAIALDAPAPAGRLEP